MRHIADTVRDLLAPCGAVRIGGLDTGHCYRAFGQAGVGGDFADVLPLANGHAALLVGDATGKDLAAVPSAAAARFTLGTLLTEMNCPAAALAGTNRCIVAGNRLVSVAAVVINPATGEAAAVSAGAEPPLVLRAAGVRGHQRAYVAEDVPTEGLLAGVERDARYVPVRFYLYPGDALLLATDGLTEARQRGRRSAFFGREGLAQAAAEALSRHGSLEAAAGQIVHEAAAFAGGRLADDACVLMARLAMGAPVGDISMPASASCRDRTCVYT